MNTVRKWQAVLLASELAVCSAGHALSATKPADAPPMPVSRSPVEFFRKLIVATPQEVDRLLQGRSEEQQQVIKKKIVEYRLYPPEIREWRLKATELRWYLTPLMRLPAESRGQLLETVPEADRPLVEARLRQWDQLPEAERQTLLNNELALQYVSRPNTAPSPTPAQLKNLPAKTRAQLDKAIDQWRSMSEQKRRELAGRFSSFFTLTKAEQSRTLGLLTAGEREQLRGQIVNFAGLKPSERARCLIAIRRFSRMSDKERLIFLEGAERWRSLTEAQRNAWRAIVNKMPPLPPGAGAPPMPPGLKPGQTGAAVTRPRVEKGIAANTP